MSLAAEFEETLADLAPDWSDLSFELVLPDETRLDEARLLMAPTQLERVPGTRSQFNFRVSHKQGYGCFTGLAQACLAKLDARLIPGRLTLETVLHDARRNMTQGPTF